MGAGANWRGGDRAGSKRPRIGARTCGELTRGTSDREIRGGGGSVAGGELPRTPTRGAGSSLSRDWGRAGSPRPRLALARRRLGALAIAWVCGCLALGANASSVRKASSAASLLWEGGCGNERRRGRRALGLSLSRRRGSVFYSPFLQANDFPDCTGSSRRICKLVRTPWYACLCQS